MVHEQRILQMTRKGAGAAAIARKLGVSRSHVNKVRWAHSFEGIRCRLIGLIGEYESHLPGKHVTPESMCEVQAIVMARILLERRK